MRASPSTLLLSRMLRTWYPNPTLRRYAAAESPVVVAMLLMAASSSGSTDDLDHAEANTCEGDAGNWATEALIPSEVRHAADMSRKPSTQKVLYFAASLRITPAIYWRSNQEGKTRLQNLRRTCGVQKSSQIGCLRSFVFFFQLPVYPFLFHQSLINLSPSAVLLLKLLECRHHWISLSQSTLIEILQRVGRTVS